MIHAASLFHDDVIDEADTRRGVPSVNKVFGNKLAILAGEFHCISFALRSRGSVGFSCGMTILGELVGLSYDVAISGELVGLSCGMTISGELVGFGRGMTISGEFVPDNTAEG